MSHRDARPAPVWSGIRGGLLSAVPWRATRSVRGQAHFPGCYWSATTSGHVIYESQLELARLLVADFDPAVVAIAAQPFWLRARIGGSLRGSSRRVFGTTHGQWTAKRAAPMVQA